MTINVIRLIYFISNGCIDIVIRTRCKFFNTQIDPPGDSTGPGRSLMSTIALLIDGVRVWWIL